MRTGIEESKSKEKRGEEEEKLRGMFEKVARLAATASSR